MGSGRDKADPGRAKGSTPEEITLDLRALAPYELGAIVLTLLAYPSAEDEESRGRLQRTLCHVYLKARAEGDETWACAPQLIKPLYAFVDPKDVNRDLRTIKRRLRDRMIAARMALAYLKAQVEGAKFRRPKGLQAVTLNRLAEWAMEDLKGKDETNIESRIWRPARPVLHIAVAMALAIDKAERIGVGQVHIGHFLAEPALARNVLDLAAQIADLMCANDDIPVDASALVRVHHTG